MRNWKIMYVVKLLYRSVCDVRVQTGTARYQAQSRSSSKINKLESFIQQESPQIVYWIRELLERQVNSVTYAELQEAMLNGYE